MSMNEELGIEKRDVAVGNVRLWRWIGALLLVLVAYIHLALCFSMIAFNHVLGSLFLINAIGAIVAAFLIVRNARWPGWTLGIVVAGGAALVKIIMNLSPGVASALMGFSSRGARFANRLPKGKPGGTHRGHFGSGGFFNHGGSFSHPGFSGILPIFPNMSTFSTIAIVVECAFVLLAIVALRKRV